MAGRISERELAIPALIIAAGRPNGEISTTDLIVDLTEWFEPEGEDAEILDGPSRHKILSEGAQFNSSSRR
jgi:hypothetical protein